MKKISKVLLTAILGVSIISSSVSAKTINLTNDNSKNKHESLDNTKYIEVDGELVPEFMNPPEGTIFYNEKTPRSFIVTKGGENPNARDTPLTYETWTQVGSQTQVKTKSYLCWAPGFNSYTPGVSGYTFNGSATVSASVGIAVGPVSVSVSYSPPYAGYIVYADYTRPSRPAIYGDVVRTTYTVKTWNSAGTVLLSTRTEEIYRSYQTYIVILYQY